MGGLLGRWFLIRCKLAPRFRLLGIALLVSDLVTSIVSGHWGGTEFWLLVLFAEYASTIRTIPPQASEQSRRPQKS